MNAIEIYPGAFHLPMFLSASEQRWVVDRIRALAGGPADFYRPTVRGGAQMRLDMLCLGLHWNATTYEYETTRSDYDGLPVPPLPADLAACARRAAEAVGMTMRAEVCIVNRYAASSKLGLHQDKDEEPDTLDAGVPVVSLSVGDTATFVVGGTRRREPVRAVTLASGDAFVMGGPSRLRYHGVPRIHPGTAPAVLGVAGRLSLTFRQYSTS